MCHLGGGVPACTDLWHRHSVHYGWRIPDIRSDWEVWRLLLDPINFVDKSDGVAVRVVDADLARLNQRTYIAGDATPVRPGAEKSVLSHPANPTHQIP